jgi:hypothetical protein
MTPTRPEADYLDVMGFRASQLNMTLFIRHKVDALATSFLNPPSVLNPVAVHA